MTPNADHFFPATCHGPGLSRRAFVIGGTLGLSAGLTRPRPARAGDDGVSVIRTYASLPEDPWAVCHGVRAMGRDFAVTGGRRAVDFLLETQLASFAANGRPVLAFPREVEVHPNAFLKTLLEAGVPLDYAFTHQGTARALNDVLDGARALFRPVRVSESPNLLPWSLIAFSRTTSPLKLKRGWTNAWNEPVDLDPVVESALRLLEEASLPLMTAMREGRRETEKAPVHGFTCGGTHMVYALLSSMHEGFTGPDRLARTRRQVDLLVWRLGAEIELIERFFKGRAGQPGAYWYELDAKLKLLGHAEECLAFGVKRGVVRLTAAQQGQRRAAVASIRRLLENMEARDMKEARDLDRELFRQLVGDACHARHGLTLS